MAMPGIVIRIGADTAQAIQGINKVEGALGKSLGPMEKAGAVMDKVLKPAMIGAGIAAAGFAVKFGVDAVKAASDIYAPAAGEVVAVNETIVNAPGDLNKDPYAAWLFRIRPAAKFDPATLLDAAAYEKGLA